MNRVWLRRAAIAPIRVYQYVVSPWLGRRCRFEPTCSHYAVGVFQRYGLLRGAGLAVWRLLKCQPFHPGGSDPIPGIGEVHAEGPERMSVRSRKPFTACDERLT